MTTPFKRPITVVRLDASKELKGVEIARDVDFIFLKYVPPGVTVYVSFDNSEYIDMTYLRAFFNPTSRWGIVRITTKGTADDSIEIYLGAGTSVLSYVATVTNIDVPLSSRASEETLKKIANALASVATDKLRVSVVDALPLSPINISQISGVALTGRDWSQDFAKLQNIDTVLSSGRLFYNRPDVVVTSTEAFFVSSGSEAAFKNLIIDGEVRVDGKLIAKSITVNGKLVVNGVVELD